MNEKQSRTDGIDMIDERPAVFEDTDGIQLSLGDAYHQLLRKKKFIILVTTLVTIAAVIVSLVLPETFKSTASILPDTDRSRLTSLGGLADLASMAGVGAADASPVKLYPSILTSETILKNVILHKYKTQKYQDSVTLLQYWDIRAKTPQLSYALTLKTLRDELDVALDPKTNIITIALEAEEPQLTADIINTMLGELDQFMRSKRTTNATKQRQWVEARLGEVQQDLADSENRLKYFREKNRIVLGSPELMLEQERLLRQVQINSTLFSELKKQYELARIEEVKNTAIINVLDPAVPAAKKEHPKRTIIVLTSFMVALFGSMAYVVLRQVYHASPMTVPARSIEVPV